MKTKLRIFGSVFGLLALLFLSFALIHLGGEDGSYQRRNNGKKGTDMPVSGAGKAY